MESIRLRTKAQIEIAQEVVSIIGTDKGCHVYGNLLLFEPSLSGEVREVLRDADSYWNKKGLRTKGKARAAASLHERAAEIDIVLNAPERGIPLEEVKRQLEGKD